MTETNLQNEPPFDSKAAHDGQEILRALFYLGFSRKEIIAKGALNDIESFEIDNKAIDAGYKHLPHVRQAIELLEEGRKLYGAHDLDLTRELEQYDQQQRSKAVVRYEQDAVHYVLTGAARALRLDKRDTNKLHTALDPILYLHKPQADSCSIEQAIAFDQQQFDMVRRVLRAQEIDEAHANEIYLLLVLHRLQTQPEYYELYRSLLSAPQQSQYMDNRSVDVLGGYVSALANSAAPDQIDQVWNSMAQPLYEHEFSEVEHRSYLLLQLVTSSCLQQMPPVDVLHAHADAALAERRLAERTAQYEALRGKVEAIGGERVLEGLHKEQKDPTPPMPPTPEKIATIAATQMRQLQVTLQMLQKQMQNLSPEMQDELQKQMQGLQDQLKAHQPSSWQDRAAGSGTGIAPGGL